MIIKQLKIENAFAFGKDATIDFEELEGHTQIIGYNYDEDPTGGASNGAAKSSIFLCLQEVLFGKNLKNTVKDDIANYTLGKGYKIILTFSKDNKEYTVTAHRMFSGKSILTLLENGIDISEHTVPQTYKKLHNIIKIDYSLFTNLTYQSQSNYLNFLTITDSEKKKFLVKLFQLDTYTEDTEYFKKLTNEKDKQLKIAKSLLDRLKADIDDLEVLPLKEEEEVFINQDKLDKLEEELRVIRTDLASISETNKETKQHRKYKRELQDLEIALAKCTIKDWNEASKAKHKQLQNDASILVNEIRLLKEKIYKYKKEEHKVCPTCKQAVPTNFNKDQLEYLQTQLILSEKNLEDIKAHLKCSQEDFSQFVHYQTLDSSYARILSSFNPEIASREILSSETLLKQIQDLECSIDILEIEKKDVITSNKKAHAHNTQQKVNKQLIIKKEKQYSIDLEKYTKDKETYENLVILNEVLKKLVTFKLESLLIHLQDSINKYIDILFSSDFALLISLKKEKLNFSILRSGKELPVVNLSTGEFNRLQIAILFAIREVLSSISNNDINILFLDEVLSSVDSLGREKIYELIDALPFKVLSISHTFFDNKLPTITIIKEKGIARIENAN